jgi:hypothetical protein
MQTITTHSFELSYDDLLKILETYILEQDPTMTDFITGLEKDKSIYLDNRPVPSNSKIYFRVAKKT